MSTETELKPCPFCGDSANVSESEDGKWAVFCNSLECFAAMGEGWDRDAASSYMFDSETIATEAWNTRAGDEA